MGTYHSLESLPDDVFDDFPPDVKRAFFEHGRAIAALRLYKHRGWNDHAVRFQFDRSARRLAGALEQFEHDEFNPPLF
uniref:Uncharacterized protein n=1 Tax=uncultured prokaryote TaxID=198431 RepID=A0A0H5PWH5_9ZZZZ|nr:hypothetical protein [uncultured prokaryote]